MRYGIRAILNIGTNCDFPCLQIALGIRSLSEVETTMPEFVLIRVIRG